jgi:hypothetical protein
MTTTKSEHVKLTIADLLQHIDDMTSDDAQRSHDADRQYMDLWQKYKSTRVEIADLRRAMGFVNAIAN